MHQCFFCFFKHIGYVTLYIICLCHRKIVFIESTYPKTFHFSLKTKSLTCTAKMGMTHFPRISSSVLVPGGRDESINCFVRGFCQPITVIMATMFDNGNHCDNGNHVCCEAFFKIRLNILMDFLIIRVSFFLV